VHNALTILSELVSSSQLTFPLHDIYHAELKGRVGTLSSEANHAFGNSITVMARSVGARLQACESSMQKIAPKKKVEKDEGKKSEKDKGADADAKRDRKESKAADAKPAARTPPPPLSY
jgi:hypothetical protein